MNLPVAARVLTTSRDGLPSDLTRGLEQPPAAVPVPVHQHDAARPPRETAVSRTGVGADGDQLAVRRPDRWVPRGNTAGQAVDPPCTAAVALHHPHFGREPVERARSVEEEDPRAIRRPVGVTGAAAR